MLARIRARTHDFGFTRYHKPGDEYSPTWDLTGSIEDLELLYLMGLQQANSAMWPQWYEGSEFRAIRERSAAERVR